MHNGIFLNRFVNTNNWAITLHKMLAMMDLTEKQVLEVPKNMRISEKENGLTIDFSWFKTKYLILIFLFPVCSYVVVQSEYIPGSIYQLTIPVLFVLAVNIGVIYYCLTRLVNTTSISVNKNRILIEHKPLPLGKTVSISREELTQLYVTKHRTAHRYYLYASTYQVNAILSNGDVIPIITSIYYPEQGRFIEKKIERFLGITDISVDGEIAK